MALRGLGGENPALDRFQQIRDLAKKRMDASRAPGEAAAAPQDVRSRAAELLRKKQAELGQGVAYDRPRAAGPESPRPAGLPVPAGPGAVAGYGRSGATERPDPGPRLGRYVDLTA